MFVCSGGLLAAATDELDLEPPAGSETENPWGDDRGSGRGVNTAAGQGFTVIGIAAARHLRGDLAGDGIHVHGVEDVESSFNRMVFADLDHLRQPVIPQL